MPPRRGRQVSVSTPRTWRERARSACDEWAQLGASGHRQAHSHAMDCLVRMRRADRQSVCRVCSEGENMHIATETGHVTVEEHKHDSDPAARHHDWSRVTHDTPWAKVQVIVAMDGSVSVFLTPHPHAVAVGFTPVHHSYGDGAESVHLSKTKPVGRAYGDPVPGDAG